MKMKVGLLILMFFVSVVTYAQEDPSIDERLEYPDDQKRSNDSQDIQNVQLIEVAFSLALPTGAFKETVDRTLIPGFYGGFLYQVIPEKPTFIGASINYGFLGGLTREYEDVIDNELIEIRGRFNSNFLGLNAVARYYMKIPNVNLELFFEGRLGGNWFYSRLNETGEFFNGEQFSDSQNFNSSLGLSYGGTLGFQSHINDNIYLTLRTGFSATVAVDYHRKIDFEPNEFPLFPQDGFELVRSAADLIIFDIGITYTH